MTSNKTVNENGRKKENDIIEFSKTLCTNKFMMTLLYKDNQKYVIVFNIVSEFLFTIQIFFKLYTCDKLYF